MLLGNSTLLACCSYVLAICLIIGLLMMIPDIIRFFKKVVNHSIVDDFYVPIIDFLKKNLKENIFYKSVQSPFPITWSAMNFPKAKYIVNSLQFSPQGISMSVLNKEQKALSKEILKDIEKLSKNIPSFTHLKLEGEVLKELEKLEEGNMYFKDLDESFIHSVCHFFKNLSWWEIFALFLFPLPSSAYFRYKVYGG